MRTGSNLCASGSYRANCVTLSLSRQEWNLAVCDRCVLIGTHLFELDSLPKYFTITIIYNQNPSDSHWILDNSRLPCSSVPLASSLLLLVTLYGPSLSLLWRRQQIMAVIKGTRLVARFRGLRVPGSKPDFTKDLLYMWAWCSLNLTPWVKRPLAGVVRKFGEELPAQVLASSSDCGPKLQCPSRNSPRIASKRDVNMDEFPGLFILDSQTVFR
ncbi:hypothetical protein AVEN_227031-1 [Araneus ventricosus]|uniref:Uncharacterized protein n=1 Tax=Araneus ventricosus TaxID=182803 RepID=A0A4Y2M4B6_ARAVE|nr:hypothetical protein AVEN_227031-1 [Araneus ventricosus]